MEFRKRPRDGAIYIKNDKLDNLRYQNHQRQDDSLKITFSNKLKQRAKITKEKPNIIITKETNEISDLFIN